MYFLRQLNSYDYWIIFLISLLAFGVLGGSLQPVRLVCLAISPYIILSLFYGYKNSHFKLLFLFLVFWFIYLVLSLLWTSDFHQGIKELMYYYSHFILFVSLYLFSKKANMPMLSLILGWCLFYLLTIPIALNELFFDRHLSTSKLDSDNMLNLGNGVIIHKKFAAVTFYNYNGYVTVLCYILPYLLGSMLIFKSKSYQLLGFAFFLIYVFIQINNASRGGLLCMGIITVIFFYFYSKIIFNKNKFILYFCLFSLFSVCLLYYDLIFEQLIYRLSSVSLLDGSSRSGIYKNAFSLYLDSFFVGTGVGSIETSMSNITSGINVPHNLFLEILVQYGTVIFLFFVVFLYMLFIKTLRVKDLILKFILLSSLLSLPVASVINSNYLLSPSLWAYLSSLFILSDNNLEIHDKSIQ